MSGSAPLKAGWVPKHGIWATRCMYGGGITEPLDIEAGKGV